MIPSADRWGPFAEHVEPAERVARLRCLRTIAHLLLGPRGIELKAHLCRAETDQAALPYALDALNRLASRDRRSVLASYVALTRAV